MFVLWTIAICFIDVRPIGVNGSNVGFSTLNEFVHKLFGVNMSLYILTDWLSLIPIVFIIGFALLGFIQLIKRRNLAEVDFNLLVLGGFYIVVMLLYILFENVIINYRPILIDGFAEASYPSSTTMLVMCVMPTAKTQFNLRIKNNFLKRCIAFLITFFTVFMVICRLFSGVHWFSDIIGGALLSIGLVMLYNYICNKKP